MNFIKKSVQQRVLTFVFAVIMLLSICLLTPSHSLAVDSDLTGRVQNGTTTGGVPTNPSIVPSNDSKPVPDVPSTGGVPTNSTKVPPVDK
jgi:hypothetical protein